MHKYSYLKYFKTSQLTTNQTQNQSLKLNQTADSQVFFREEAQGDVKFPLRCNRKYTAEQNYSPHQQSQQICCPKSEISKNIFKRDTVQTKWSQYENQKILPHVSEIFSYKITNELLSNKIKNPKRDKLITFSFHSPQKSSHNQKKNFSKSSHSRNKLKHSTKNNRASTTKKYIGISTFFGDLSSPCINYNDAYTLSLQNQRMGKRIFNARSMVDEYLHNTYFTYHLYNGKITNKLRFDVKNSKQKTAMKKLNNGLKVFFNNVTQKKSYVQKQPQQNSSDTQLNKNERQQIEIANQNQSTCSYSLKDQMETIHFNKQNQFPNQIKDQTTKSTMFRTKTCKSNKRSQINNNYIFNSFHRQRKTQKCPFNNRSNTSCHLRKKLGFNTAPDKQLGHLLTHHYQSHNPFDSDLFGKGSTVLSFRNFEILCNPRVKQEDLIILELLQSPFTSKTKNIKGISTNPIAYRDVHKQVRFAINTKLGHFLSLRIWKYTGINAIQIGVFDINLKAFGRDKHLEADTQVISQQKDSLIRDVLMINCHGKLRRKKRIQIDVRVSFDCLLYNKKFRKFQQLQKKDKQNNV